MLQPDKISEIEQFHKSYLKHAGLDPDAKESQLAWFERCFYEASMAGITAEEWDLVLRYLSNLNRQNPDKHFHRRLSPTRILDVHCHQTLARFMEDLSDAKKWKARIQARQRTGAQVAVDEFRNCRAPESVADTSRSIKDVLRKALDA